MRWKNFSIWQGRLPHWRADGVLYYVTFRHRRELDEAERMLLFRALMAAHGKKLDLEALCVLPENTELLFRLRDGAHQRPPELSKIVESGKAKAGKQIITRSGERFSPFYAESYDRIVRDEAELAERLETIVTSSEQLGLVEDASDYPTLFLSPSES